MLNKVVAYLGIILLAGSFGVAPATAEDEMECKTEKIVRTGGDARTVFWAKKRARDAWRQKVDEQLGEKWSAWYLSEDPDYSCTEVDGKHRCQAQAIPCRSRVVVQGPRKICIRYQINGTGEASTLKEWAKHKARAVWGDRVEEFYGDDFDTWLLANNRDYSCSENAEGEHTCTAMAKPCKFRLIN